MLFAFKIMGDIIMLLFISATVFVKLLMINLMGVSLEKGRIL